MEKRFHIILLLLLCISIKIPASHPSFFIRHYYDKINLAQASITQITQDDFGYIWLRTWIGIFRFDGNNMTEIEDLCPNSITLQTNSSEWISPLKGHKILFSNGDLYDNLNNTIEHVHNRDLLLNRPQYDKDQNLWFNTNKRFFYVSNETSDTISIDAKPTLGLTCSPNYVWGIDNGTTLMKMQATPQGIRTTRFDLSDFDIADISIIKATNDNELLIGSLSQGLSIYNTSTKECKKYLAKESIKDIEYHNNSFWIATHNGLFLYKDGQVNHAPSTLFNEYPIKEHNYYALYNDREGGLWISGFFTGLSYIPKFTYNYQTYNAENQIHELDGTIIKSFAQDKYGNIWFTTENQGIYKFNKKEKKFTNYNTKHGFPSLDLRGLFIDNDKLWCGSFHQGMTVFDIKKEKVIKNYTTQSNCNLKSDYILCFMKTSKNEMLIGTIRGIQKYRPETDSFEDFLPEITSCTELFEDSKNTLWIIGTECMYSYNATDGMEAYPIKGEDSYSIMETKDHDLWVSTTRGIAKVTAGEKDFEVLPISIVSKREYNYAYRIEEDNQGFLWVSTADGLIRYNPSNKSSIRLTTNDGLPANRFQVNSSFKDNEGNIYFGSFNGFICIDPYTQRKYKTKIQPQITEVSFHGIEGKRMEYKFNDNQIVCMPKEYNITINYSSLAYTIPKDLYYRYRLEPIETEWNLQQGCSPISYTGLNYGSYQLYLQASDVDGQWAEKEVVYTLVITPPLYLTTWAKTLYIISAIISLLLILYFWKRKENKKQQLMLDFIKDRTEKEIYQTKVNFFTAIVHEIRTPLTMITSPLEEEISHHENSNLLLIQKNANRLHELCNQLLEFRKMDSNELQPNYTITNIPQFVSSILENFKKEIEKKQIVCTTNLQQDRFDAPIDRDVFIKIMSNLISNAIKYGKDKIDLELKKDEKEFFVSIKSNGKEITRKEEKKIFDLFYRTEHTHYIEGSGIGLFYCRFLTEKHGGKLNLKVHDGWNDFQFFLPLSQKVSFVIDKEEETTSKVTNNKEDATGIPQTAILIVDDEPDLRTFIRSSLERSYKTFEAANGVQALEIIRKENISLVITDVMMPRMDGCELCRELKNDIELCGIPIIMLTAKTTVQDRMEGYLAGAEEYIDKPFSIKYLQQRIEMIVEKQRKQSIQNQTRNVEIKIEGITDFGDKLFIEKVDKLIQEYLKSSQLNIPFVCEHINMAQSTFYKRFKEVFKLSPNDYIRIKRLEYAAQILREVEQIRISDVAYELNFSSPSYFTRCFIQHFGISPTQFVAKHKKQE